MPDHDWSHGYVADVDYTFGYYPELNPLRARLPLLNRQIEPPTVQTACELGYGQGLSIAIHAAASGVAWWGTDFNPSQASFAQTLARAAHADARLFDEAFAEFAARPDLPDFDFMALHGIWSWISDENRRVLVDLIRRKLRPGGLLYISYNAMPGWASFLPLRNLLVQHAEAAGGERLDQISRALDFAERLLEADPAFARLNPKAADRLRKLRSQDRQYLAHEYFNRDWRPMHFSETAALLASAKLSFAASANYLDHVDDLNLSAAQKQLLNDIGDPVLRQTARDLLVNQQFRKDYWVKGLRRLSGLEQSEQLRRERIILASPRSKVSLKVTGVVGEAALNEAVYGPVLDSLSDYKPKALGEIAEASGAAGQITMTHVTEAAMVLGAGGSIASVQGPETVKASGAASDRLNAFLMDRARSHADTGCLASPVTGGGVGLARFDQLFLSAVKGGAKTPEDWARASWSVLSAQGQRIVKDGAPLASEDENLAEVRVQAEAFGTEILPVLRGLGLL